MAPQLNVGATEEGASCLRLDSSARDVSLLMAMCWMMTSLWPILRMRIATSLSKRVMSCRHRNSLDDCHELKWTVIFLFVSWRYCSLIIYFTLRDEIMQSNRYYTPLSSLAPSLSSPFWLYRMTRSLNNIWNASSSKRAARSVAENFYLNVSRWDF
jgi:hypothetical protein